MLENSIYGAHSESFFFNSKHYLLRCAIRNGHSPPYHFSLQFFISQVDYYVTFSRFVVFDTRSLFFRDNWGVGDSRFKVKELEETKKPYNVPRFCGTDDNR